MIGGRENDKILKVNLIYKKQVIKWLSSHLKSNLKNARKDILG